MTDGFQTYEDAVQAHLDAKNEQIADYRKQLIEKDTEIARLKFEHEEMRKFFRKRMFSERQDVRPKQSTSTSSPNWLMRQKRQRAFRSG